VIGCCVLKFRSGIGAMVSIYQLVWMIVITGMPLLRLIELYLRLVVRGLSMCMSRT
jgi:hypothetical protein